MDRIRKIMGRRVGIMLVIAMGASRAEAQPVDQAMESLIAAERAFAALSVKEGMKEAFLSFLADDAILFRPGPVNGREVWRKAQATSARLEWHPTVAFVASGGDLGYTSGPWVYTPEAHLDQPPRHGYFVSVWKKQASGKWKVVLDLGTSNEPPATPDTTLVIPQRVDVQRHVGGRKSARRSLLEAEKQFSRIASTTGLDEACSRWLSDDARVYRPGAFPLVGKEAVLAQVGRQTKMASRVLSATLSFNADLAYAYGTYNISGSDSATGHVVRLWRRESDGMWKLVLEILSPVQE